MNPHETRELHGEFLDGTLSEEQNLSVDKHLEACAECRADLESLRKTVHLIASAPRERAPETVLSGIMARVGSPQAAGPRPWRVRWTPALQGLAAVLLIGIFLQIAVRNRPSLEATSRPAADSDQPRIADLGIASANEVASRRIEAPEEVSAASLERMRAAAREEELRDVVLFDNRGRLLLSQRKVLPPQDTYVALGEKKDGSFFSASREEHTKAKLDAAEGRRRAREWDFNDKVSQRNFAPPPFAQIHWVELNFRNNERTQEIVTQAAHNNAARIARSRAGAKNRSGAPKPRSKPASAADGVAKDKGRVGETALRKGTSGPDRMLLQLKFYLRLEVVRDDKESAPGALMKKAGDTRKMARPLRGRRDRSDELRRSLLAKFPGAYPRTEAGRRVMVLPSLTRKDLKDLDGILRQHPMLKTRAGKVAYRLLPVVSAAPTEQEDRSPEREKAGERREPDDNAKQPAPAPEDTITVEIVFASAPPAPPVKAAPAEKKDPAKKK